MHLVVAAALVRDGRVLLGHRSATRTWYPDVWDVVGWHVEDGETYEVALRRELQEEIGVLVGTDLGEPAAHIVDPAGGRAADSTFASGPSRLGKARS